MRKLLNLAWVAVVMLQGCAYTSHVPTASGAAEIMPSRRIEAPAYVRIDPELTGLSRKASTGFICSAHNYTVNIGASITESILNTVEGAFNAVTRVESQTEARNDGYFLDFYLSDFAPRLRFDQGFWTVTSEANVELSLRVRAFSRQGGLVYQATVRGEGRSDNSSGGCPDGDERLTEASRKAVQRTMEDLVQKTINSRVLVESELEALK